MLFDNKTKHAVSLGKDSDEGKAPTVGFLVKYLCANLMKDSRKELFVVDENVYVTHHAPTSTERQPSKTLTRIAGKATGYPRPDQRLRLGTRGRRQVRACGQR
jgi:hypothetical protein